jgi:tRNA dimethylallyltransferase
MAGKNHQSPIFIAGPTAVGKSEVALQLAETLGGEIISVDSMQVYRGLDIGTAKPSAEERQRVPHHLIDVVNLSEPFDAAQFVRLAQAAVTEIQSRAHVPIFCGGTGLYFKAFLQGLGEAPPADESLRAELKKIALSELLNELAVKDPITFEKIDRQNPRRVIRAIEVIRLTGKPFSAQRANWQPPPDTQHVTRLFALSRESTDLQARINTRVDIMFQRGLVNEVKALLDRGLSENKIAMQAIGYRQVVEHLQGEHSPPETIELVKIRTRQFAKRQMTWFRHQANVKWIQLSPEQNLSQVADQIRETVSV